MHFPPPNVLLLGLLFNFPLRENSHFFHSMVHGAWAELEGLTGPTLNAEFVTPKTKNQKPYQEHQQANLESHQNHFKMTMTPHTSIVLNSFWPQDVPYDFKSDAKKTPKRCNRDVNDILQWV